MISFLLATYFVFGVQAQEPVHADTAKKLSELRNQIRTWAPVCADGTMTNDPRRDETGKMIGCPHGDMTIFAGLLCLSGEKERCNDVKRSQDSDGRWWRSPGLVGENNPDWASFSRDQSRGVLAYLVATRDKSAAEKWMDWLENHRYRLCTHAKHGNDACNTGASFWANIRTAWRFLDLPVREHMEKYKILVEALWEPIEAELQSHNYPMNLNASTVWIYREMEARGFAIPKATAYGNAQIAQTLASREPMNPFFHYLAHGADEYAAEIVLDACPATQPDYTGNTPDWIWQRGYNWHEKGERYRRWLAPSGWDCIFAINLLLGPQ